MPLVFFVVTLASRLLGFLIGPLLRRLYREPDLPNPEVLPKPIRLLFLAFLIRWTISSVALSLFARQIWSSIATLITIAASVWLLILVTGWIEQYVQRRLVRRQITGMVAIVRLVRGVINLLVVVAGVLVVVYRFGLNPTAFLTGIGVGGVAVALAAQKTLENVIGGVSLILDRVVRLGDTVDTRLECFRNDRGYKSAFDPNPNSRPNDGQHSERSDGEHDAREFLGTRQILVSLDTGSALRDYCGTNSHRHRQHPQPAGGRP